MLDCKIFHLKKFRFYSSTEVDLNYMSFTFKIRSRLPPYNLTDKLQGKLKQEQSKLWK